MELERSLEARVVEIYDDACDLVDKGKLQGAFEKFSQALALVPAPIQGCSLTAGILAGLGEVYFRTKSYDQGQEALSHAMRCSGAIGNPFLHLRLGQCEFELGNDDRASDELAQAYLAGGKRVFSREDPRYLEFLKTRRDLPRLEVGPWSYVVSEQPPTSETARRQRIVAKPKPRPKPFDLLLFACKVAASLLLLPLGANLAIGLLFLNPLVSLLLVGIPATLIVLVWSINKRLIVILLLLTMAGLVALLAPTWGPLDIHCGPGACN